MNHSVIDPEEMQAMVVALLTTEAKAHAALYAETDPAIGRYLALRDPEDREDFRTALRDFTRTYAFLGQVVPFRSTELEKLFYYGKVLLVRLPKTDDEAGGLDLGDAVVLTHIRTQITGEDDLALADGVSEPVSGISGGGRGGGSVRIWVSRIRCGSTSRCWPPPRARPPPLRRAEHGGAVRLRLRPAVRDRRRHQVFTRIRGEAA